LRFIVAFAAYAAGVRNNKENPTRDTRIFLVRLRRLLSILFGDD
jgi:2-keto-3-deoxy-galactonokinase